MERVKVEETVVEHLISEKINPVATKLKIDPNYNNAVYKFVVDRFHKKYENKLSEDQKKFLTKYCVYLISENKGPMSSAILKEVETLKTKLKHIKDESVSRDADLMKKLTECHKNLVVTNFSNITEENVLDILQYMNLIEELES